MTWSTYYITNTGNADRIILTYLFFSFDVIGNLLNVLYIIQMLYKVTIERIVKNWDNFGK